MKYKILPFLTFIAFLLVTCEKEKPTPDNISNKITITTAVATGIEYRSATINGTLGDTYGRTVQDYGHCWDTAANPELTNNKTSFGNQKGSKAFTSQLQNLLPGKLYFVRAYFTIDDATVYSMPASFSTKPVGMPVVETDSIKFITIISVNCWGNVLQANDDSVIARGVCWNKSGNPTIKDSLALMGKGLGKYSVEIKGLSVNTKYYIRAFATNTKNTDYGKVDSFTTDKGLPILTTVAVTEIYATTAKSGGNISYDGGFPVTARGVCYSTTSNPTIENLKTINGTGTGSFVSSLSGLSVNTTYYVRAYATNSNGTNYGINHVFTTKDGIPKLTVTEASNIRATTTTSGGNITDDGGSAITVKGVCWSTSPVPTLKNYKTSDGTGTGTFTSSLNGLKENTKYYISAYAINSIDTAYSTTTFFTTKDGYPVLTTTAVTNIAKTTATSGGIITEDWGFPITAKGVCWSTNVSPAIDDANDFKTIDGSGTDSFVSELSPLDSNSTYYVRAYATNSYGTGYGNQESFKYDGTKGTFTDSRDNHEYKWVKIGDQIWMAENLAWMPIVSPSSAGSDTDPHYYVYGYDGTDTYSAKVTNNYKTYGVLYNWSAAMNGASSSITNPSGVQGVCPDGWHLPSDAEWTQLTNYVGGESVAGGKLKEAGYDHWLSPNTDATNSSGFTALPGGYDNISGDFKDIGGNGSWWSATVINDTDAWYRSINYGGTHVVRSNGKKVCGFSVRCLRD